MNARILTSLTAAVAAALLLFSAKAKSPRVLPAGQPPNDSRLGEPVTLHDYHPFRPMASVEEWEKRQKHIKLRLQVGSGLWPLPTKTPLRPVIHGRIDRGDYTVERVFFESMPGHFVTGSLYRPAGESLAHGEKGGKRPAVLCPHGHWKNGRFYDAGQAAAQNAIAIGAERFLAAARSPLQARCVQLARMGCVVFHYDMLGNADSIQFREHRRGPRKHLSGKDPGEWGFVSQEAAARVQTNFGLQTWNSIRALDFILGLDDTDESRVLVTGASGGATQTMMVSALDDRIDAAFPCVMASTAMQGGCTCENTYYLRIGQGNIDIAAAVAPRPLGLTAADDWTVELKTKGHPDLQRLYEMLGVEKNYEAHFDIHFKHNYNHVSRTHMYQFANRHFGLGFSPPVFERDFEPLRQEEMTVWSGKHSAPAGVQTGDAHEKALNQWWATDSNKQIEPLPSPGPADKWNRTRQILGGATEVMIGRTIPTAEEIRFTVAAKESRGGYVEIKGLIENRKHGEELPATVAIPGTGADWKGPFAVWISPQGKASLFSGDSGTLAAPVQTLIDHGIAVLGVDLFGQGEFPSSGQMAPENQQITFSKGKNLAADSWQRSPVYFYGYNHSIFARRVHDILSATACVRHHEAWNATDIAVIGLEGAGHWVAAARAMAGSKISRAIIGTGGFRFANVPSEWDADFLPGAVKYGDLPGFLIQSAPHPLTLIDKDPQLKTRLQTTYRAAGAGEALECLDSADPKKIAECLTRTPGE